VRRRLRTHLLIDWLGADNFPPRGVQLLWPFSHAVVHLGLDVFRQTARRQITSPGFIRLNLLAIAQEMRFCCRSSPRCGQYV